MPPRVLLIEDDDDAAEMVARTFRDQNLRVEITRAKDGQEALDLLRGSSTTPVLSGQVIILLDLYMPRLDGFEFLEEYSKDPNLEHFVTFVLTDSDLVSDRDRALEYAVEGYVSKARAGSELQPLFALLQG